jgi:hypothetical protein
MHEMIPNILSSREIDKGRSNMRLDTIQHKGNNFIVFLVPKASGTTIANDDTVLSLSRIPPHVTPNKHIFSHLVSQMS